jgi:hypothetical protein
VEFFVKVAQIYKKRMILFEAKEILMLVTNKNHLSMLKKPECREIILDLLKLFFSFYKSEYMKYVYQPIDSSIVSLS